MKNILITGGAGYIGSHIAEILVKKRKNIFIVDNLSTGFKQLINKKAKLVMTKMPYSASQDTLVAEALNIMNTKKITS